MAFVMDQDIFTILPTGYEKILFYTCLFQYSWITCTSGHSEHNDSLVVYSILLHRANIVSKKWRMGEDARRGPIREEHLLTVHTL